MNKIINIVLVFIIVCTFVTGNINVDIGVDTAGGDANINVNSNTGTGDTTYILDGVDYKDSVNDLSTRINSKHQLDLKTVWYKMSEIFIEWDYENDMWVYRDPSELTSAELRLKQGLDIYFATQYELQNVKQDLGQIQLEVLAMQKLFPEEEICRGRLLVSKDLDIKRVNCGNTTYINNGDEFIGVRHVKNEKVEEPNATFKNPTESLVPSKETLDRYKTLCDKGIPKFCKIVNTYEYLYVEPISINNSIYRNNTGIYDFNFKFNATQSNSTYEEQMYWVNSTTEEDIK